MRTFEFSLPNTGRKITMSAPQHLFLSRHLEEKGMLDYESDSIAAAAAICSLAPANRVFYDVGANVGIFSMLIAGAVKRNVVSCEPTPEIANVLRETATRNALPITVVQKAISKEVGSTKFFLSNKTDMSHSLNESFRQSGKSIDVEIDTVDNVVKAPPALIKIDTETTEPDVLEGSVNVISKYRPPMIIEVLLGRTEERLNAFFANRGYHAYHISPKLRWRVYSDVIGDRKQVYNNWLFSPEPLGDDFWNLLDAWRWRLHSRPVPNAT